ncbi:hypothetical protein Leryth_004138 [Lithospermum erythrorhizon]|nr:hypothetical protein Leryth_004138 [Lithospermum erythrorhizon]
MVHRSVSNLKIQSHKSSALRKWKERCFQENPFQPPPPSASSTWICCPNAEETRVPLTPKRGGGECRLCEFSFICIGIIWTLEEMECLICL